MNKFIIAVHRRFRLQTNIKGNYNDIIRLSRIYKRFRLSAFLRLTLHNKNTAPCGLSYRFDERLLL